MSNPCTRCGNERIPGKTWKETLELYGRKSIITHAQFICPDPECQKIVERQLLEQKQKTEFLKNQKELERIAKLKQSTKKPN